MCQTRCGESRLRLIFEGIAVNKITSKYSMKGSMPKVGIELFSVYTPITNIYYHNDSYMDGMFI